MSLPKPPKPPKPPGSSTSVKGKGAAAAKGASAPAAGAKALDDDVLTGTGPDVAEAGASDVDMAASGRARRGEEERGASGRAG